jgi:hypothetical protein
MAAVDVHTPDGRTVPVTVDGEAIAFVVPVTSKYSQSDLRVTVKDRTGAVMYEGSF